ncbi:uncharacterized protein LOC112197460 isoform X2 [Rosa chinensis]|uniref:uncharacterized protein LOC112197460 isoform X2 n=1 Tax=Rosa chinensis TaxID=74649 RepID=UPI000D089D01|nr:uncharacterized protein LOC112197460 isoform X2 [Rosa chinensis]
MRARACFFASRDEREGTIEFSNRELSFQNRRLSGQSIVRSGADNTSNTERWAGKEAQSCGTRVAQPTVTLMTQRKLVLKKILTIFLGGLKHTKWKPKEWIPRGVGDFVVCTRDT